jgi:hypothetical protein
VFVLGAAAMASADNLAVNLSIHSQTCCSLNIGALGSPAEGQADYSSVLPPWSIQWQTGAAYDWCLNCGYAYSAYFNSGTVTMVGPDNLTFTGEVTYAEAHVAGTAGFFMTVDFSGQWSNHLYGYGTTYLNYDNLNQFYDGTLQTFVAPEPGSLALLVSGMASLWSMCSRFIARR